MHGVRVSNPSTEPDSRGVCAVRGGAAASKTTNPMGDMVPSAALQVFVNNPAETRFNILGVEMQIVNVELKPGQCGLPFPRAFACASLFSCRRRGGLLQAAKRAHRPSLLHDATAVFALRREQVFNPTPPYSPP